MMYTTHKRHLLVVDENCFVVITIIHHSTVGVFILLKIWYISTIEKKFHSNCKITEKKWEKKMYEILDYSVCPSRIAV